MGDATTLADTIRHLKALGVSIAVDDFGTGYSNLGYLQRFAAGKIKIDQSFVRAMLAEPEQQAIVTAIIQMGKSLKLLPHAEGVESDDARALLLEMGCRTGQGYWFARPLAADMLATSFLRLRPTKNPARGRSVGAVCEDELLGAQALFHEGFALVAFLFFGVRRCRSSFCFAAQSCRLRLLRAWRSGTPS